MNRKYNLKLDLQFRCNNSIMKFNQFDNNTSDFFMKISSGGKSFDVEKALVVLAVIKPSGKVSSQFVEIENGLVYADLKPNMVDEIGIYTAQAMLILEDERVVTDVISYEVEEDKIFSLLNDTVGTSEEFTLLTDMLSRLSTIEISEEQRVINEAERILSEENRKIEEAKRVEVELIRQHEEADRAKYDATRESNENIRKINEEARISSENVRLENEANRIEQEANRVKAEQLRKDNYNLMTEDEERRRSEANAHKEAEALRVSAENTRVNEEAKRRTTEQARVSAENTRVSNENTRKANEVTRQTNETQRVEAETQRQNRYNSFIADAEANTSNFENYTNNAKIKEEERKSNELDRKSQETKRVSNEVERISNENTRKANEVTRIESEKQRADAENLRKEKIIEIQSDYDSLKKVIIDENASANLQNQINQTNSQLEHNMNELENQINRLDTVKANKSITENLQTQINTLVLESGGDSNLEVVQARGDYRTLNDRIDNVEIVKSYDDVMPVTDISYNLAKASTFTMTGFNGTDLVKIPVGNFNGETKYTVIMKFTSDAYLRSAFKIYDNTWGSGKVVKDLGITEQGAIKYMSIDIDVSGYDQFALLRLSQIGQEYGATVNLEYLKVVKTNSLADIDNFDELFNSFGDVQTYIVPRLKVLPSNIIDLLSKKEMPSNTKLYIDAKTEGSEALKIFDAKSIKNNIYNYEIPKQVITNEGNGTKIVQIPLSDLANLSDEVTLVIKYRLNSQSTKTTYALRIFDANWGAGIIKDLGSNNIANKEYFVTYTFNKSQFKDWVLFRFSRIGDSGEVVLDIDYVKLFNSEDFTETDEIDGLHNIFGNIEEYPLVNFKVIPSNLENMLEKENKNIVMIGDSIANQFAGAITDNNGNSEYNFMNKCIGGETTLDTMARLGAIPYTVLPPFTIPSDTSNSEEVNIVSSLFLDVEFNEVTAKPTWKNGYLSNYSANENGLNPYSALKCEIAGVKGTLYFKRSVGSTYFKRDIAGEQVVIDRPTEVIPIETSAYDKDAVYTCFMGTNEGWCNRFFEQDRTQATANKKDAELLFSYYKRISQYINTNKFLFMGFYMCAFLDQQTSDKRIEFWDYFEELMSKEFGNNYFSVRKYLREIGYKDANIQLTSQDLQDIKDGKIPIIASTGAIDGVHVTSRVAACVGNEILKRLKGLGYISSYNEIDVMKYDNGQTSTNPDDFLPPQE